MKRFELRKFTQPGVRGSEMQEKGEVQAVTGGEHGRVMAVCNGDSEVRRKSEVNIVSIIAQSCYAATAATLKARRTL